MKRQPHPRRVILAIPLGQREPELPPGLTIIDRRVAFERDVEELLVAGDMLRVVPEMAEAPTLTLEELVRAAAGEPPRPLTLPEPPTPDWGGRGA